MRLINLVILLLVINSTNGQIKNGVVKYNVIFNEDEKNELFAQARSASYQLEYTLLFNSEGSLFYVEATMNDDLNFQFARILAGENTLYQNLKQKLVIYNNSEYSKTMRKNEFLLKDSIKTDWVLHNEIKMIDSYRCYKATSSYQTKNKKGTFTHPITAWYCPEIPFGYGPKGYGALPGLILELQENKILFGAKQIEFNNKSITITMPSKGKQISQEEYTQISAERSKEFTKVKTN